MENQDPLHNNDSGRADDQGLVRPVIDRIVVKRTFDRLAALESGKILNHPVRVKCIRVVIIQPHPLVIGQVMACLVIVIVVQDCDFTAKAFRDLAGDCRLAAPCPAGNPDHNDIPASSGLRICSHPSPPFLPLRPSSFILLRSDCRTGHIPCQLDAPDHGSVHLLQRKDIVLQRGISLHAPALRDRD